MDDDTSFSADIFLEKCGDLILNEILNDQDRLIFPNSSQFRAVLYLPPEGQWSRSIDMWREAMFYFVFFVT